MFSLYVALVYDVSDIGYKSRLFFKDHSSALETDTCMNYVVMRE